MHPPFIFTDHKVDPHIYKASHGRKTVRRSKPETLRLSPTTTGWPPVPLLAQVTSLPMSPSGQTLLPGVFIQIVPPPRNTLRDQIGRWLIRIGQRMILENRPG